MAVSRVLAEQGRQLEAIRICEDQLPFKLDSSDNEDILLSLADYHGKICEYDRSAHGRHVAQGLELIIL